MKILIPLVLVSLMEIVLCWNFYSIGFQAGTNAGREAAGQTANGLLEAGYIITNPEGEEVEWFTDDPKATPPAWVVARRTKSAKK